MPMQNIKKQKNWRNENCFNPQGKRWKILKNSYEELVQKNKKEENEISDDSFFQY
jgi:hypothetical protein